MTEFDPSNLTREDAIVAKETILNLKHRPHAMSEDALRDAEAALSEALGREPEY